MNEQEDMGVSLLEENKLFVVYDYESGRKENYSGVGEKVFIFHCLNKFGYLDDTVIKDNFDKIGHKLNVSYLSKKMIGPFSNNSELETCLEKFVNVHDYNGIILLSLSEFNEVLISARDIQETRKGLLKKGKLLLSSKKNASGRSLMKKIFGS